MFDYSCKYDGIDETTGRKKVKLGNLAEFGQKVLDFLKNAIESFYPDCQTMVNDEDKEDKLIDGIGIRFFDGINFILALSVNIFI